MKMKNNDLLDMFLNGNGIGNENHTGNLWIDKYNMLVNYGTIIALYYDGKLILNATKYSSTTSKHQNYIRRNFPKDRLVEVDRNEITDYATKVMKAYWEDRD